jgi:hypothetical protein
MRCRVCNALLSPNTLRCVCGAYPGGLSGRAALVWSVVGLVFALAWVWAVQTF